MRIVAIEVSNIGGLADGRVVLPRASFTAIAGANGTGKSKLLAAALAFWSSVLPSPRAGATAIASIEIELTDSERHALAQFSVHMGWGELVVPEMITLSTQRDDLRGFSRQAVPAGCTALDNFWSNEAFLQANRSLNPMYLPAERRLLPSNGNGIDLAQLDDLTAYRKTAESRTAVQNYGRLDDQEFEQFAKALCIADKLDDEEPDSTGDQPLSRVEWPEFLQTVNALLSPKVLLPLTKSHPDQLRIQLPNGETHPVPDLSSGERQALIIISRVLRAGAGHSLILIDEPDAYLHPNLSQRLVEALERGVGTGGQLVVATHSPSILDRLAPSSILRLSHDRIAQPIDDEDGRIELYRTTGFRASALTQSELLVITEGELDEALLCALYPELSRASIQRGDGRTGVLQRVRNLARFAIPIIGLVDRDVEPPQLSEDMQQIVHVLPSADIEGAFLSDEEALKVMIDRRLVKQEFRDLPRLVELRDRLYASKKTNVIAEIAKNRLRTADGKNWPSSKGPDPIARLRAAAAGMAGPSEAQVEDAVSYAEGVWSSHASEPWKVVRGKYIVGEFNAEASEMKSANALLEAVANERPSLAALSGLHRMISQRLAL
ncbi:AAA family ATPase [Rhodococcus cerastii]|nr:AAA family ATPase [Rhodococcus cerastii]